ncbi:MAG: 16S rRNA (cytosine(1402)-N(4))-methyltransferase RsmH [Chitinophagales bacterium]
MKREENKKSSKEEGGGYHTPVLLHESIEALAIKPDGIYVDATFGGGGHSRAIMAQLGKKGKLFAFDQDEDAQRNAIDDKRFQLIPANFRELKRFLRLYEAIPVDGILADFGVSSFQFDTAERGFSYRFDGPLDMRMDRRAEKTAADVVNEYSADQLQQLFSEYGEVRNSKTLAQAIVNARGSRRIDTIEAMKSIAEQEARGEKIKYLSQVFQSLRIEVNDELGAIKELLMQSVEVLKPKGRLAVITFHSLEDRLVKNFIKHGSFGDEPVKDFFGNFKLDLKAVNKKPIEAGNKEQRENSRSRSAKLRVAERI